MLKKISWSVMTLSATAVAVYAFMLLALPNIRSGFVQNLFENLPNATSIHFIGGAIAIVTGAIQLNTFLRKKSLKFHRWLGRIYVFAIAFSGVTGLVLALNSVGGFYAQSGFGLMSAAWLATTLTAYRVIRAGNVPKHERWMIRSYAVTLGGVTLRLYLGLSVLLGLNFADTYPVIAWLCWVPNLLIAEVYLRLKANKKSIAVAA